MSRKRSLSAGLFGMGPAIAEAAVEQLTPDQRAGIDATKAQKIMEAAIACAGTIGRILEGNAPEQANPPRAAQSINKDPPALGPTSRG